MLGSLKPRCLRESVLSLFEITIKPQARCLSSLINWKAQEIEGCVSYAGSASSTQFALRNVNELRDVLQARPIITTDLIEVHMEMCFYEKCTDNSLLAKRVYVESKLHL